MYRLVYQRKDGTLVIPIYGFQLYKATRVPHCEDGDVCDSCGDCLECYSDFPCPDGDPHLWVIDYGE